MILDISGTINTERHTSKTRILKNAATYTVYSNLLYKFFPVTAPTNVENYTGDVRKKNSGFHIFFS